MRVGERGLGAEGASGEVGGVAGRGAGLHWMEGEDGLHELQGLQGLEGLQGFEDGLQLGQPEFVVVQGGLGVLQVSGQGLLYFSDVHQWIQG